MKPMKPKLHLSQTQYIAYGFLAVILLGTCLLMLPASSRNGEFTPFIDSLFTATSATCVTGLIVYDTWSHWSLFGQAVILGLIQIGGLGFITIGIFFSIILRRKIGLKARGLLQESVNTMQIGGVVKLAKKIVVITLIVEGTGAFLLSLRFVRDFGLAKGIYFGIFHSVSAFCNAGFDLMGTREPFGSLVSYSGDWLVNLVIMSLITIGGIGFIVWDDLGKHKLDFRKYMLHTKIVLVASGLLTFGGAFLWWICERNNLLAGMLPGHQVLASLFSSVTARTAGFNTTDVATMSPGGMMVMIMLMFVGGSPGSTAGGVKTTTVAVMIFYLISNIKRSYGVNVFGRRLEDDVIGRASSIFILNLLLIMAASLYLLIRQSFMIPDVLFETFSAMATVGISTGITRDLLPDSRLVVAFLMYCGRVGSLSFALSLAHNKQIAHVKLPVGKITIG